MALAGKNGADVIRRGDAADVRAEEQHELLQHDLICLRITLQDITQHNR